MAFMKKGPADIYLLRTITIFFVFWTSSKSPTSSGTLLGVHEKRPTDTFPSRPSAIFHFLDLFKSFLKSPTSSGTLLG